MSFSWCFLYSTFCTLTYFDLLVGLGPSDCFLQLLMCGTGDISVSDFKAHAVVVGGSWHFREKVSGPNFFQLTLCRVIRTKFQEKKVKESEKQTC